jgi:hypothetical protein
MPLFRRRRPQPSLKHRALFRPQPDFHCIGYHSNVESRIRLQRKRVLGDRTADQWQQDAFGQVDAWLRAVGLK